MARSLGAQRVDATCLIGAVVTAHSACVFGALPLPLRIDNAASSHLESVLGPGGSRRATRRWHSIRSWGRGRGITTGARAAQAIVEGPEACAVLRERVRAEQAGYF